MFRHDRTHAGRVGEASGNQFPVLDPIEDQTVVEGTALMFTVTASDPDIPANMLTFSLDPGAPTGMSIGASDGQFSWMPTEEQGPGTYPVTVRVTDDGSPPLSDARSFTVTVVGAPIIQRITVTEGSVTISWQTVPGRSYVVESAANLVGAEWAEASERIPVTSTLATWTGSTAGSGQCFYRIVLLP